VDDCLKNLDKDERDDGSDVHHSERRMTPQRYEDRLGNLVEN
jgi:hypothetical protein